MNAHKETGSLSANTGQVQITKNTILEYIRPTYNNRFRALADSA